MSSYVAGTAVRCRGRFKVTDTGVAYAPAEVIFRAHRDGGGIATEKKLSLGEVVNEGVVEGWQVYRCDFIPDEAGTWWYQFGSTGSNAVVQRDRMVVRSAT